MDIRFRNGMQFGLMESVVYGGPGAGVELAYLNPFSLFANAQLNEGKEANENLALDVYIPVGTFRLLGQVLIDDYILDGPDKPAPNRKTSSDRLGWLLGIRVLDISRSRLELRYERVGSYTYNVKQKRPWQSYTYESRGLGYPSNDADTWTLFHTYYPSARVIVESSVGYTRQGERTLQSNDFEDSTFVKLPFPSGIVKRSLYFRTSLRYSLSMSTFITGGFRFSRATNDRHVLGRTRTYADFSLSAQWFVDRALSLE
jgi:hypothetical protein